MAVTLNTILATLSPYRYQNFIPLNSKRNYVCVSILPPTPDLMMVDALYMCRLSEALKFNQSANGFHYLCVRDCLPDAQETEEALSGLIVINEEVGIGLLFSLVQKRFLEVDSWISQMKSAFIKNNGNYQELLNLSELVLQNAVYILDASYSLVAYTKNNIDDEEVNKRLLEKGFHPDETLKAFRTCGRFKAYAEEPDIIINQPGNPIKYATISKWLRSGSTPLVHVIMVCNKVPPSPCLLDVFHILLEFCNIYFQQEQLKKHSVNQIYDSLITDMIYGQLNDPSIIEQRAKCLGIPLKGNFDVFCIVFNDSSDVAMGRFIQDLFHYLPNSKIIAHHFEIIVLNSYNNERIRNASIRNTNTIHHLLKRCNARCGVSESFDDFRDLTTAYIQATRAIDIGEKLIHTEKYWGFEKNVKNKIHPSKDAYVFYYDDIYIYHMLTAAQNGYSKAFQQTACNLAIARLMEYDRQHHSSYTQILYTYLISERKPTTTGELLHMHRNNVQYHISKIEELLNLDLNDHWVRLKLIIAFCYMETHLFLTNSHEARNLSLLDSN